MNSLPLSERVQQLAALLIKHHQTLSTAESCTGGLVAKLCTDLAGSSAWFDSAAVTYSNAAKTRLLGVPAEIFRAHGAVSEPCVRAMVRGLVERGECDWGVAITGIAGPGGAVPGRPVGTVWMAWLRRGQVAQSQCWTFDGDREAIREAAARAAIEGLIERLAGGR
jgi:nicotinamide-nucleotide amidase